MMHWFQKEHSSTSVYFEWSISNPALSVDAGLMMNSDLNIIFSSKMLNFFRTLESWCLSNFYGVRQDGIRVFGRNSNTQRYKWRNLLQTITVYVFLWRKLENLFRHFLLRSTGGAQVSHEEDNVILYKFYLIIVSTTISRFALKYAEIFLSLSLMLCLYHFRLL